ncbi:MAG: hypothetical protein U0350_18060 [Caldilineaceae bacterium]
MANTRLSRRKFLQFTGGALAVSALAACAPVAQQGSAPAAGGQTAGGKVTVAQDAPLWAVYTEDFHPDYNAFIKKALEDFGKEKGYPMEIATTAGFVAGGADIQKMAAAVASGTAPDLWHRAGDIFQLKKLGLLVPVTDVVKDIVGKYGDIAPRPQKEVFTEGDYYAVPHHVRSDGGWWRKDIWDAAGIDPTKLKTYDELRDACLQVSNPDKQIWGWGMTVNRGGDGAYLVQRVIQGFGGSFADETGQYVTIDSPETVAAVEWLVDTYKNPKWAKMLPPGVLSWTDPSNNEAYLGGKVAYTQNAGTVYAKAVLDKNPVAPNTVWDKPKGGSKVKEFFGLNSKNWFMIKNGKNPEAARELINSFFNDDALKAIYKNATTFALPAYSKMWDWPEITSVPNSIAHKTGALDPSGWNGIFYPGPGTPQLGAVASANIDTDIVAAVLGGQATAAEAVKQAAEKMLKIFKEMGAPGTK